MGQQKGEGQVHGLATRLEPGEWSLVLRRSCPLQSVRTVVVLSVPWHFLLVGPGFYLLIDSVPHRALGESAPKGLVPTLGQRVPRLVGRADSQLHPRSQDQKLCFNRLLGDSDLLWGLRATVSQLGLALGGAPRGQTGQQGWGHSPYSEGHRSSVLLTKCMEV